MRRFAREKNLGRIWEAFGKAPCYAMACTANVMRYIAFRSASAWLESDRSGSSGETIKENYHGV
jgi:hypothetical protein